MKRVDLISQRLVFDDFFKIMEANLSYERYDSMMSPVHRYLNFDRGNSVAALLYHSEKQCFLFAEQFRYPTYTRGEGWLLELVAGGVKPEEDPEKAILREIEEETGYKVDAVEKITSFYPSPGGSSEKILLYYAILTEANKVSEASGLNSENEDIKKIFLTVEDSFANLQTFRFSDAKIIIALQWFFLKFKLINVAI